MKSLILMSLLLLIPSLAGASEKSAAFCAPPARLDLGRALHKAVERGDLEMVKECLGQLGEGATREGVLNYTVEFQDYFLGSLVDLDEKKTDRCRYFLNPLQIASYYGFLEIAELLIENGADVNFYMGADTPTTPLNLAAANRKIKLVSLLLAKGAKVNLAPNGFTPLMYAAFSGHSDIVSLLLSQVGISVNAKYAGHTALSLASSNSHTKIVKTLLAKGAAFSDDMIAMLTFQIGKDPRHT